MTTKEQQRQVTLEKVADLLTRIWYYGDWGIETPEQKHLENLVKELELWPCTEDDIIERGEI